MGRPLAHPRHKLVLTHRARNRVTKFVASIAAAALVVLIPVQSASATEGENPTQSLSCEAVTADYHRPLTNGDHINVTVDPPGGQVNMYVDQNIAGGASYNGQNNLGLRWKILGVDQTPIPLTSAQVESGVITFNYGAALKQQGVNNWKVTFVQTNGTDTWPNKECGEKPTPMVASLTVNVTPPTCEMPSQVSFEISNATWDSEPVITAGAHTRGATAVENALFANGTNKDVANYIIEDKLPQQSTDSSAPCYVPPAPVCVDQPNYTYTFDSTTGGGAVTVTGGKEGDTLCKPLYIRATAYTYDLPASGSPSWPQTMAGYNDTLVDKVGTFTYAPPQVEQCRQYDAYASFDGWESLAVSEKLNGPNNPFEPAFLHDTLSGKGPNPTYSYTTSDGCNVPPPPTPKVCVSYEDGPTATNLDEVGWNHNDTRTSGAYEYVDGGIRLHTTDSANPGSSQNKVTLYRPVDPMPLSQYGEPSVVFADGGTGVKPGMQVGVDVNGDGTFDGYLVGEPWSYGEHNWWVNKAGFNVPAGMGYTSFGSWADFVAANPDAMVVSVGLSLGSGVLGDWTVTSFTGNCVTYAFDNQNEVVKDATASVADKGQATCTETGTVEFFIENATWDGEADLSVGTHTRTATAVDGHQFADGSTTATVTYTIADKLPEQSTDPSGECYVPPTELPGNPDYQVLQICGSVTFNFTNAVELGEGQSAPDAEFTYTDADGATQTVTVPANEMVVRSVTFPEDSGDKTVTVGVKGEKQETLTVLTDCEPNLVNFKPTNPTFVDQCGLTNDGAIISGKLTASNSSTDNLTGNVYRSEAYVTDTGVYFAYYTQINNKLDVEIWFLPDNPYAVPTAAGKDDTYTIEYGLAVWRHSFTNEACPVPPGDKQEPVKNVTVVKTVKATPPIATKPSTMSQTPPRLATTGADNLALAATWIVLLVGGGGAMVIARNRRKTDASVSDQL